MKRIVLSAIRSRPFPRRGAANESRTSHARHRSIVENCPCGIYRVTGDGRFVALNPALCDIVGYSADELFAANISVLYPEAGDRDRLLSTYDLRPQGTPIDVRWRHKDGRIITIRTWVYGDRDAVGTYRYFDGYVEDVTALRATEQALSQAERLAALGQLLSGVAHELNNPLSAILLFTDDLLSTDRPPDEQESLTIIGQQARRSRAIVRDLLSFVRNREVVRKPVQSTDLIEQLRRALEPQLANLGVAFHVDASAEPSALHIDRLGIEQVVTNLVMNAAQAACEGGNVWLRAFSDEQNFFIDVEDDGAGISSDTLPRVFEPFFTSKPVGQGTGLGLSVSLGVVQQHGGSISAANRDASDSTGARFLVRLPLPSPSIGIHPQTDVAPPSDSTDGRHVLIIDNEANIRHVLSEFFTHRGWIVTEACDGSHAVEHIRDPAERCDLVISEVAIAELSSVELHAAIEEARPELLDHLVFCTGEDDSEAVSSLIVQTGCTLLHKPFEMSDLADICDGATRSASAVAARSR